MVPILLNLYTLLSFCFKECAGFSLLLFLLTDLECLVLDVILKEGWRLDVNFSRMAILVFFNYTAIAC
jgi:hypothetical protein